eukprot:g14136.t1
MNTKFGDPGKVDPTLALQDFKLLQQHAKTELRWPADRNGHRFDGDVNPFFWKRRAEYELVLADAKDAKELWSKLQWDEEKQRGAVNTTVPEGGDEFNCQQLQAGWRLLGHNMESLCKELQFDPDNKDKANDCKYEPPVVLTFEGPEVEKVTTYKMLLEFIEYIRKLDANEERAAASKKMTVEGGGRLGDRRLKQIVDVLRIAAVTNNRNSAKGSFVNIPDLYLLVYFCWKTRGDWTLIQAWWLDRIKKELRCLVEDFKKDHKPEGNLWLPDEICRQLQEVWEKGGPQNLDKSQKLQKLEQVMEKRNEIERQRLKDEQRRRQEREQQRKFEDMKAERERQSEKERREDALKEQERKAKAEQDTLDWAQTQEKHAIDKAHREEKMRSIEEREARRKLDEDAKKTEYAQRQEDLRSRAALQLQQKQKEDEKAARCEAEAIELGAEGIRLIKNAEDTLFAVSGTLQCRMKDFFCLASDLTWEEAVWVGTLARKQELTKLEARSVSVECRAQYGLYLDKFKGFCTANGIALAAAGSPALADFMDLLEDGKAAHVGEKTVAALEFYFLQFKNQLPRARRALRGWRKARPATSRLALPRLAMYGIAMQMVADGQQLMGYYVKHRAHNQRGPSSWSETTLGIATRSRPPERPDAPVRVDTPTKPHEVVIRWTHPECYNIPVQHYQATCQRGELMEEEGPQLSPTSAQKRLARGSFALTQMKIKGLRPSTIYYFQVRACNQIGSSDWSVPSMPMKMGSCHPARCERPRFLSGNVNEGMKIYWQVPDTYGEGEVTRYDVRFSTHALMKEHRLVEDVKSGALSVHRLFGLWLAMDMKPWRSYGGSCGSEEARAAAGDRVFEIKTLGGDPNDLNALT